MIQDYIQKVAPVSPRPVSPRPAISIPVDPQQIYPGPTTLVSPRPVFPTPVSPRPSIAIPVNENFAFWAEPLQHYRDLDIHLNYSADEAADAARFFDDDCNL